MKSRILPGLAVIGISALVGLSVARVASQDYWLFSLGGAAIAAIALAVLALFNQQAVSFQQSMPAAKLLGIRIGLVGFLVALSGWLLAVFWLPAVGFYIVVIGIAIGFVGFPIHIYNMFRKNGS